MNELSTNTQPRGLALATFDDAARFSKLVASSDFAPKDFRGKPESCLLAIQHGAELGLGPMQALQSIAVVNGRPSVFGDTALAVCLASHVCEYVRERVEGDGDAMVATCEAKRRGNSQATVSTFSVADAKRAGLWGKSGPWSQYPRRMLQMRARGFALRDAFPDAMRGLVTAEEAQDYQLPEPGKEPVIVRPKFDPMPADEGPKVATARDLEQSRLAVNRATTAAKLEAMRDTVEDRLGDGFYTTGQADELLGLINHKLDMLQGGEVPA